MSKKKGLEDVYYPIPQNFSPMRMERVPENKQVVKQIIQGAVRAAYRLRNPAEWDYKGNPVEPKAVATNDQMAMIMHLIESLQPTDAIEAVLASQFAVVYIRGMKTAEEDDVPIDLFEFGHKVLEAMQKYRSKGAQQISVQYLVNQGQVVNIKNVNKDGPSVTLDGEGI